MIVWFNMIYANEFKFFFLSALRINTNGSIMQGVRKQTKYVRFWAIGGNLL